MNSAFEETKIMFMEALMSYVLLDREITYDDWMNIPDELKAAALYVNFYQNIKLAWLHAKANFTPDEDGVSTVMQYLQKNVDKIRNSKSRYKASYIYKIAYNCLGCLRRNVKTKFWYENSVSQYQMDATENQIADIFETIIDESEIDTLDVCLARELWNVLLKQSDDVQVVADALINKSRIPAGYSKQKRQIIQRMQMLLKKYRQLYINNDSLTFEDVLNVDDKVDSAVVEMSDGNKAVYYGETIDHFGKPYVVFFGATQDYVVAMNDAKSYKVLDVQLY